MGKRSKPQEDGSRISVLRLMATGKQRAGLFAIESASAVVIQNPVRQIGAFAKAFDQVRWLDRVGVASVE